ncbi:MAG: trimethylamine methyltransferase family protein, partial [Actinobacteria bacterium]|nr:trimethylamine methyltransferase family protein [Actinomycetota bacterium]
IIMALKGFPRNFKPLDLLTEEQIEFIYRGVLAILQETGIRFKSEKALKLFKKNDCIVDDETMIVKFPPYLIEECIRKTPSTFHFKSRDPKDDLEIGGNVTYFSATPGMNTVDLETWDFRKATRKETTDALLVLDSLENVHFLTPYTPYFGFEGVEEVMAIPEMVAAKIRYTTLCQIAGYQKDCEIFNIQIANASGAEIQGMMEVSSPLMFDGDAVESAIRHVEAGFPIHIASGLVMGGSSPVTTTASVAVSTAEILSGITFVQLLKPGTRIIAVNFIFPQNMVTGSPFFGNIGISLQLSAFCQLWRKFGIPVQTGSGSFTNSKRIDFQAGYERSIFALISALSGAHMIQFHGGMHGEITAHPVQAIIDDDVAGMIGRYLEGIHVDNETLALDLIKEVGPLPGFYLGKKHTREWWKKEQFMPKVADMLPYPEWKSKNKKSVIDHARDKMENILATHKPTPLTVSQEQDIEGILKDARKYYKDKGMIS